MHITLVYNVHNSMPGSSIWCWAAATSQHERAEDPWRKNCETGGAPMARLSQDRVCAVWQCRLFIDWAGLCMGYCSVPWLQCNDNWKGLF